MGRYNISAVKTEQNCDTYANIQKQQSYWCTIGSPAKPSLTGRRTYFLFMWAARVWCSWGVRADR